MRIFSIDPKKLPAVVAAVVAAGAVAKAIPASGTVSAKKPASTATGAVAPADDDGGNGNGYHEPVIIIVD